MAREKPIPRSARKTVNRGHQRSRNDDNVKNISVSDILIHDSKIYVTGSLKIEKDCNKFTVYESNLNFKNIEFKKIFQDPNCYGFIQGGRVQYKSKDNSILVSTAADILKN